MTIGVSIRPQPWVEILFNDDASQYRRMEMALAIDGQYVNEDNAIHMASALAGFAHVPWNKITWLGEGHTLESAVAPQGYEGYIYHQRSMLMQTILHCLISRTIRSIYIGPVLFLPVSESLPIACQTVALIC